MAKNRFTDGYRTYDTSSGFGNKRQWRRVFEERMSDEETVTILSRQEQTPYEILEVSAYATQDEIKSAFKKKIMEWHPDRNPQRIAQAEEQSKLIIAAYNKLKL